MASFSEWCMLIVCFIFPMMGVIGAALVLIAETSVKTQCIVVNKSYSEHFISSQYPSGAQGSTSSCGPTLNYQSYYEVSVGDYNLTTILCGVSNAYVNCCSTQQCSILSEISTDICPPLLDYNLTMYNTLNISSSMECWLHRSDGTVKMKEEDMHAVAMIVMFVICTIWVTHISTVILCHIINKICNTITMYRSSKRVYTELELEQITDK